MAAVFLAARRRARALGKQNKQECADGDCRDQHPRDIGRGDCKQPDTERRRQHRERPNGERALAVGIGVDELEANRSDQHLQQNAQYHRLARRHDQTQKRHKNERQTEACQPANIGGTKSDRDCPRHEQRIYSGQRVGGI